MDIYIVKISDVSEEQLNKLYLLIDSDKKHKIKKFINKEDKIRSLIGEILIRTLIIEEFKIDNSCIKFEKNQYGKPYLSEHPDFYFNISHSGEYVLCAIDNNPIGVDIEEVRAIEYEEISKSFFTINEFQYIINKELNSQLNRFYEIWTLKESYIKCCGEGLSIPLKSFTIEINQHKNIKVVHNAKYTEHIFKKFDVKENYKIAVCSLNKEISNNIIEVNQGSLINKYFRLNYNTL
ncbi:MULTISPECIES: 4'-phosphopantetheinyl transferase superfamily protein [Clostridium]|uniref:4'-phosphopantetheinyl transferase superfamily protein n=1 Tax=Clostridium faecium TaxID=2762223 RepID=A0ABR8YMP4_9CLOT|nr:MULTISPECIES: 4'-phosphopantetheinyl transferase superfamily protein [Clostridium]MBD8045498.1 4'-phosphopantetheinyl transferase superfamily protein [Clostridium faecium]MDU1348731.1 4'-phosphopantetheinyl transferase superfamily protein [Clostridium argentinense]